MKKEGHSAAFFGDFRDYWWNRDFLELMARRWELANVHTVLDVGCGIGHWGRILSSVLPPNTRIAGIDREPEWIEQAQAYTMEGFSYCVGDVLAIPFPDNSFDLVTCQTLLIHVSDPLRALSEMFRVVRPGGIVIVAEPNNRVGLLLRDSLAADSDMDDMLKSFRFLLLCERGQHLLGEGDISLGDLVPGLFAKAGAEDIRVYLSDKTSSLFPPYVSEEQQTLIQHHREMAEKKIWFWEYDNARRYFLAGGGTEAEFDPLWIFLTSDDGSFDQAVAEHSFHSGGAALMYLVSGRKSK